MAMYFSRMNLNVKCKLFKPTNTVLLLAVISTVFFAFTVNRAPHYTSDIVENCGVDTTKEDEKRSSLPYIWKSVQIVGGGFVDGIVFHPTAKNVRYCRTDIGGAYRWNNELKKWEPMMDWVSEKDNNLMGVESIALDPVDSDKLYMACGTYTSSKGPNAILRSNDRGKSFKRTDVPFRMGGNENGRGNGERMAVDPNNGNIIYMGTRLDGLWTSRDAGVSWHKVETFNSQNKEVISRASFKRNRDVGIIFVLFDKGSEIKGKGSSRIYAGLSVKGQNNFYCSNDAGLTWLPVPNQPTQFGLTHGVMAADGTIFLSYGSNPGPDEMTNGAVWKFNIRTGNWTDITPIKPDPEHGKAFGYAAVAVDAHNPDVAIASSFNRYSAGGEDIFRTTNGGKTWKPVFTGDVKEIFDYSIAPYIAHTGIHWLFDIEIDPFNSNHAMFTTGYGGHETFNFTDVDKGLPAKWTDMSLGIEETVAMDMVSPAKGASLVSAIGDYGGFVHWDINKPSPDGNFINPRFNNTNGIACGIKAPAIMVRVGEGSSQARDSNIGYSTNGGKTWQTTASFPEAGSKGGHISVSANGSSWIWSPQNEPVYITPDMGITWTLVSGLPANMPVVADTEDPNVFYAVDVFRSEFFKSADGGRTFNKSELNIGSSNAGQIHPIDDRRQGTNQLYSTPGKMGDIWLATLNGLFRSKNSGTKFTKTGELDEIRAFGFGKAATAKAYPVLYAVGTLNGVHGVYRSEDTAKTWIRINDDQHQWGLILKITGDPKVYGRVYIGTHGRGILYGDVAK
jgi:photosystem II stability/assembly factor-like uncharacterized protein